MPDSRRHRGAHPDDVREFAPVELPALRRAASELTWLLDRDYAMRSALELVGNRHELTQRQRLALARSTCTATQRDHRRSTEVPVEALADRELWIDGYNLLITIESALSGGVILRGRDRCLRDLASLHGTYRAVSETLPALRLIGETLAGWRVRACHWLLDRPVSNSGRLRETMLQLAVSEKWTWDVQLEFSPDHVLATASGVAVSSDSAILDRCRHWVNAARAIIEARIPQARVIDLRDE